MANVKFLYAAVKKFGKRISLQPIYHPGLSLTISRKKDLFGEWTRDAIQAELDEHIHDYPLEAWLLPINSDGPMTCPGCGAILSGFLSAFKWGIQHGVGYCSSCEKVEFRYYHYVGKVCLHSWAICGFTP